MEMQLFPRMHLLPLCFFSPLCRRKIYGPNLIEVPVKSYARLLVEEVCIYSCASTDRVVPGQILPLLRVLRCKCFAGPFLAGGVERTLGEAAWAVTREGRATRAVEGTRPTSARELQRWLSTLRSTDRRQSWGGRRVCRKSASRAPGKDQLLLCISRCSSRSLEVSRWAGGSSPSPKPALSACSFPGAQSLLHLPSVQHRAVGL